MMDRIFIADKELVSRSFSEIFATDWVEKKFKDSLVVYSLKENPSNFDELKKSINLYRQAWENTLYKDVETNSSYKTETNMYSNISIGYANFAISSSETTLVDCSYNSNGFAVEYNYGIRPIKKIGLYFETGLKGTYTFAKDVFVVYVDDLAMDGLFKW